MVQVQDNSNPPLALTTRRQAQGAWKILEERLEAVRQEVERYYFKILQTGAEFGPAGPPALLQAASVFVSQPLDADTLRLRQRLGYAFGLFGTSFWRRPPLSLRLDLLEYADRVAARGGRGRQLNRQLHLALEIIRFFQRRGPGPSPSPIRAALSDPEAMRLTLLLEERQALSRRINETTLRGSCQIRIATGHRWLALLQPHLPAAELKQLRATLAAATAHLDNPADQSFSRFAAAHQQLDLFMQQVQLGGFQPPLSPTF